MREMAVWDVTCTPPEMLGSRVACTSDNEYYSKLALEREKISGNTCWIVYYNKPAIDGQNLLK